MNTSISAIKSRLIFFLLVFGLSSPFWLVGAVTGLQVLPGLPVSSLVIVSPVIAALILVYRENGIAGITKLLKRSFDYKRIRAKVWYAPIILFLARRDGLGVWTDASDGVAGSSPAILGSGATGRVPCGLHRCSG